MSDDLHDLAQDRTANRLSLPEQMRAVEWLKANREYAAEHSQAVVATTLGGALGRIVTVGNLGTVARAAGVRLHGYVQEQDLAREVAMVRAAVERVLIRLEALEESSRTHGAMGPKEVAP